MLMKLVCFGDSITAGHEGLNEPMLTAFLKKKLPPTVEIINAGVSGDTTVQALARIVTDVISHQPDLVTVLFGANDVATHKRVEQDDFAHNIDKIASLISPKKTILITPAPVDESLEQNRTNEDLKAYSDCIKEIAQRRDCHFIDFFTTFFSKPDYQWRLKGTMDDGLHFGEKGYDLLSDLIAEKIAALTKAGSVFKQSGN
ncbi:esterase [Shouchella clausii]|uniref:Esterase n=2 Tax=Shouchella clausii TaxID=79880 RepID=Q5WLH6_SHOC1|nr:esterase [Shouchella clausii KSM-K16]GIN18317.1 esterase [Shouchella clausii]